jgi:hypothetical protein
VNEALLESGQVVCPCCLSPVALGFQLELESGEAAALEELSAAFETRR